jgi:hypothetical protein
MLLIVGVTLPSDSTRRVVGYGGVLPLPAVESTGDAAPLLGRLETILELRHDARSERGRVLYATGRAPAARSASTADRASRPTRTCRSDSSRQVVQGRATGASPNS